MFKIAGLVVLAAACGPVVGFEDPPASATITLSSTRIEEQAAAGTAVGRFSASDSRIDRFELIDDADRAFAIAGDTLQVANGARLNFEAAPSVSITVRATGPGGAESIEDLTISITDVREVTTLDDSGSGSLRQALSDAAPGERILFETLLSGKLAVASPLRFTKAVTLSAPGSISIEGTIMGSLIEVGVDADVTLANLVIDNRGGGAIINDGKLAVVHSQIFNSATTAIANRGRLAVTDSTFQFNRQAIAADGIETVVTGSTFANNTTNGSGGAIVGGPIQILNCTFSNNIAGGSGSGGAIALVAGTSTIAFSTFADNQANGGGGGVFVAGDARATIRGSVFAHNAATGTPDVDSSGNPGALSGIDNILTNGAGTNFASGINNNLIGVDVVLNQLFDNGGPTATQLPAGGSVSIDHVPVTRCFDLGDHALIVDQRGLPRPRGGGCDAGSTEVP